MMPFNKKISSRLSSGFMLVSMGALFLWFSSCVTMRDVVYFQGQDTISAVFRTAAPDEYEIKPDDELYLQVTSKNQKNWIFLIFRKNGRLRRWFAVLWYSI